MLNIVALFVAGLGLFFHGLAGLRQSMQGLASRRVRRWLADWSRSPLLAGLGGFGLGGLTQSVTAVAFIVASLVGGGLLTVGRALPIVAGANLGTALLVLVASFDVHLAVLLMLGTMGVAVAFELGGRARSLFGAMFFAALLFFGLRQMREAFVPLGGKAWFAQVAAITQASLIAPFVLGAVLRLFIQSSPAIAILAITLSRGGLLGAEQAIAMMFGTGLGVGGAVFLLSTNLRGVPRQVALYQALLSMAACGVVGLLLALERCMGWPLLLYRLRGLPGGESLQLALAFVTMQLVAVTLAVVFFRWFPSLLERLSPVTSEQELARPEFINEAALQDPESALVLAAKEQQRLLNRLPELLETVCPGAETARVPAGVLHGASATVAAEIHGFLESVGGHRIDAQTTARWLELQRRQELVVALNDTAFTFVDLLGRRPGAEGGGSLRQSLAEGLHALTCVVVEAVAQPEDSDRALLLTMTADRGEMLEKRRREILDGAPLLHQDERLELIHLTSLFERHVWLLRQLIQSLGAPVR